METKMELKVNLPGRWLAEVRDTYNAYVTEWIEEEAGRSVRMRVDPEPPQEWSDYLIEYLEAELENSVG